MIFVDMDGTIAKFYKNDKPLEEMYEKGFFLELKPYKLANYINKLASKREDIYILSTTIDNKYCKEEKLAWLHRYCPNIKEDNIILVPYGTNKGDYVYNLLELTINDKCILIDDYSKNLYEWEMCGKNFTSIKFINGINNKKGIYYKYKIKTVRELKKILAKVEA